METILKIVDNLDNPKIVAHTIKDCVRNFDEILNCLHDSMHKISEFLSTEVDSCIEEVTTIKNTILEFMRKLSKFCSKMIALYELMLLKDLDGINQLKTKTDFETLESLIVDCDDLIIQCKNLGLKLLKNWDAAYKKLVAKWLSLCTCLVLFSSVIWIPLIVALPHNGILIGSAFAAFTGIGLAVLSMMSYFNSKILLGPIDTMIEKLKELREQIQDIKSQLSEVRTQFLKVDFEDSNLDELKSYLKVVLQKLHALQVDADTLNF